jgi:phospholipid/cholesterol/gamma-HCH transport system substrate-binding protein
MSFPEAPNVLVNTPVRRRGVVVGRVTKIQPLDDKVRVTATLDKDTAMYTTDVARITSSLLGGDAAINIEPGADAAPRKPLADGGEIEGRTYTDPIQVIGNLQERLSGAIGSITSTSTELGRVVHQVGEVLQTNQERINRIVAQADDASRDAKETVRSLNEVFGNPETKAKLKDAADQLPDLIRTTRQTVGDAGKVMAGFNQNLTNLDAFTAALQRQGPPLMSRLGDSAETLDRLSKEMLTLTRNINEGRGTLGVLATDRELYDNINRTVANVESLSRELRPILRDARVFTDSIARHPEKLGVRGALQPSTGTKW